MKLLMLIATAGLSLAGLLFLALSLAGYETLSAALGCVALALLFAVISRQQESSEDDR